MALTYNQFLNNYQSTLDAWLGGVLDTAKDDPNVQAAQLFVGGNLPQPTYLLAVEPTAVGERASDPEGNTVKVTLTTTGVAAGTKLAYTLVDNSPVDGGEVNAADFTPASLIGEFTVGADGKATAILTLAADEQKEGAEAFTVKLDNDKATSDLVTIADTSVPVDLFMKVDLAGRVEGAVVTGVKGVAEAFTLSFDSVNGTTAVAVAGKAAVVTIEGFVVGEDILRFDDASDPAVSAATFLTLANISADPFGDPPLTNVAFLPPTPDADGSVITLAGIQDATLGGITPFFEVI